MRFQIHRLQQSVLVELGLNTEDALLLDWLLNWKDGNSMKHITIENDLAYWVNYGKVVEELPILFKQIEDGMTEEAAAKVDRNNRTKVGRMLKGNLSKVLQQHKVKTQNGTDIYLSLNRDLIQALLNGGNKKATTAPTVEAAKENNKSNKSICNSDTNNTPVQNKNIQENIAIKLLKENNIKNINEKEAIEIFTDLSKLKKCIERVGKVRQYKYLLTTYKDFTEASKSNKGINSYEGDWINADDLDERIERSQMLKYS